MKQKQMSTIRNLTTYGILLSLMFLGVNNVFAQTETSDSSLVMSKGVSQDGSVIVTIISTTVEVHKPLVLQISFTDPQGNKIVHENYGIRAMQQESNGITVLSNQTAYAENGDDLQTTLPLDNSSPVNFQVQLQGSGLPGTDPSTWKGQIDTVGITVVPEFGSMVLVTLVSSLVATIFLVRKFGTRFSYMGKYAN